MEKNGTVEFSENTYVDALCNIAITIANIEGCKLACAHTQSRTLCNNVGFSQIGHIHV